MQGYSHFRIFPSMTYCSFSCALISFSPGSSLCLASIDAKKKQEPAWWEQKGAVRAG